MPARQFLPLPWLQQAVNGLLVCCLAMTSLLSLPAAAATTTTTTATTTPPALTSVPAVDLDRYQGRWYQIALYPNFFQRQCVSNTTADYTLMADGSVLVLNQCTTADGSTTQALGAARVDEPRKTLFNRHPLPPSTSRLEVRFAPKWLSFIKAVWAPYWVIQLADDYRYAVIGEPDRKFLWILSRTPALSPQDEATIKALLTQQGYDPSLLQAESHTQQTK
jgi:apolipoprotein D and lipocalin family protein